MNTNFLTQGPRDMFQPDPAFVPAGSEGYFNMQKRLAFLVGLVAFGLPLVLMTSPWLGETCFRDSISHFYYSTRFGTFFVGCLFFIGGFLIAYRGESHGEGRGAGIAGLGAIAVAMFPTKGDGCEGRPDFDSRVFASVQEANSNVTVTPWPGEHAFLLFENAGLYHGIAAGIVFTYLGLFCLVVMRRIAQRHLTPTGDVIATKLRRNGLYFICGVTIIACVAALAIKTFLVDSDSPFAQWWDGANMTFIIETIALWAFGTAWFVKSRLIPFFND